VLVSYVLRLVPAAAADGRIVGELEAVRSGEVTTVHDITELVALIKADQLRVIPIPGPSEEPS
jgi:hypothetical protein